MDAASLDALVGTWLLEQGRAVHPFTATVHVAAAVVAQQQVDTKPTRSAPFAARSPIMILKASFSPRMRCTPIVPTQPGWLTPSRRTPPGRAFALATRSPISGSSWHKTLTMPTHRDAYLLAWVVDLIRVHVP
jgi:hypothetical protein